MGTCVDLSQITSSEQLQELLLANTPRECLARNPSVALYHQGNVYTASAATTSHAPQITRDRVPVRCVAKVFTATLVAQAVAKNDLKFDSEFSHLLLDTNSSERRTIESRHIAIRHLLNHTHGLDDSNLSVLPHTADQFIDVRRLAEFVATQRALSPPGELFCYSHLGYWLVAAVLERRYKARYAELLAANLFAPLGLLEAERICRQDPLGICPASGGALHLSSHEMLEVLRYHLATAHPQDSVSFALRTSMARLRRDSVPMPQWHPAIRRLCLGWSEFDGGWFGHAGESEDTSLIARFSLDRQCAIAIVAFGRETAPILLSSMFSQALPDLACARTPQCVPRGEKRRFDGACHAGIYASAGSTIDVRVGESAALTARLLFKSNPTLKYVQQFRPAMNRVFVPTNPNALLPWIEFLQPTTSGECRYVTNGLRIWSRSFSDEDRAV